MPKRIFVDLPVRDLTAATRFYQALGCEKHEQFSSDQAAMMSGPTLATRMQRRFSMASTDGSAKAHRSRKR